MTCRLEIALSICNEPPRAAERGSVRAPLLGGGLLGGAASSEARFAFPFPLLCVRGSVIGAVIGMETSGQLC